MLQLLKVAGLLRAKWLIGFDKATDLHLPRGVYGKVCALGRRQVCGTDVQAGFYIAL